MGIGVVLVLFGVLLAVINIFVTHRHLLTAAVILIGLGVLAGGAEVL